MAGEEILKITVDELENLLTTKNIIGESIDLGEKIVIPVTRYGFGFGGGGGHGQMGDATGSGAGGGIEPVALIIVHKEVAGPEGIQVLSLRKDNPVAQVISALSESLAPQVIEAIKAMSAAKQKGAKEE